MPKLRGNSEDASTFTILKRNLDSFQVDSPILNHEVIRGFIRPIEARAGYELAKRLMEDGSNDLHAFAAKSDAVCVKIEDLLEVMYVPKFITLMEMEAQRLDRPNNIQLLSGDQTNVFMGPQRQPHLSVKRMLDFVLNADGEEKLDLLMGSERYQVAVMEYSKELLINSKYSFDEYFRKLSRITEFDHTKELVDGLRNMYAFEMGVKLPE